MMMMELLLTILLFGKFLNHYVEDQTLYQLPLSYLLLLRKLGSAGSIINLYLSFVTFIPYPSHLQVFEFHQLLLI